MKIEEPYEYRERLTMPKFMVNASGDQFFLPDSSQFYFDDLQGRETSALRAQRRPFARQDRCARERAGVLRVGGEGHAAPEIKWTFEKRRIDQGDAKERPAEVRLWQATNPKARDFRLDDIGPAYQSTGLSRLVQTPGSRACRSRRTDGRRSSSS